MKFLKSIPGKAVALAALAIVFAGSILLAHAGRDPHPDVRMQEAARVTPQATPGDETGWMIVPRGSLIDAAL